MRVALVTPCPVPYTIGGAQRLWWGWADYINEHTQHVLELFALPSPEHDFFSTVSSYESFYRLNLDHFDRVISCKYPGWMIQHRDHHLYMLHTLRGLYDTYTGPQSLSIDTAFTLTHELVSLTRLDRTLANTDVAQVFELVRTIARGDAAERALYTFPGYLARAVVHALDRFAMEGGRVRRFCALSDTVRRRAGYFPSDAKVTVIHPPTNLVPHPKPEMRHFLANSRFDSPKRMELIVQAYRQTQTSIPLKLAGTGPTLEQCKSLAQGDARIEFLGFVSDAALVELYSKAAAVVFVPQDEDYGYVTLEAFLAARPVITASDAGGPTELVRHGVNGWIVTPTASDIAHAITQAAADLDCCRAMGQSGLESARHITWQKMSDWATGATA